MALWRLLPGRILCADVFVEVERESVSSVTK